MKQTTETKNRYEYNEYELIQILGLKGRRISVITQHIDGTIIIKTSEEQPK